MANANRGDSLLVAAIILGASVLGAGYLVSQATERAGEQIVAEIVAQLEIAAAPPAAPARNAARPRRGPDPEKRYEVDLEGSPALGPADAPVIVAEFSDFQCPFCARVWPTLQKIRSEYGDQVQIVFKHLPLSFHSKAPGAHAASIAAHKQDKFWEMHTKIFENQPEISEENYIIWAGDIGLDVEQFKKDSASAETKKRMNDDMKEASALGVSGTPGFFINGRFVSGAKPFSEFKIVIDEELKEKG